MAEVNTDAGGGGGKHKKKGRKSAGTPRIDMTPMVDLAFLLLTFFVLTSQLNKPKATELIVPKPLDKPQDSTMKIPEELAVTVMLDGNKKGTIYYYEGQLSPNTELKESSMDPKKGFRSYVIRRNNDVVNRMEKLRQQLYSGKISKAKYDSIALTKDYRSFEQAPFFIIKWGGDATYGNVLDVLDELKIGDVARSALTKISPQELQALSAKTGIKYKDLENMPATPAPTK
jgi:biopolymer transport protein ExbD